MSFKSIYNKKSLEIMAKEIKCVHDVFDDALFVAAANKGLNKLELKDRVNHIALTLIQFLPNDFKKSSKIISKALAPINADKHISSFEDSKTITGFLVWPLTRYTQLQGMNHFNESMNLLKELTQRFTSEFAIRSFINHFEDKAYAEIFKWKSNTNFHIRRLASEGTRPLLPWGEKVDFIIKNIDRNLALLKGLEKDESEYVRKSVANHLNDISKINQDLFFEHINDFDQKCPKSTWVKRHAMRTLLKSAHPKALKEYGYSPKFKVSVKMKLGKTKIKEGESLPLAIEIINQGKKLKSLIEYKIYYMKSNGKLVPKIFRLRDTIIGKSLEINKKISFARVTTRKHYSGKHMIEIVLNGKTIAQQNFILDVN